MHPMLYLTAQIKHSTLKITPGMISILPEETSPEPEQEEAQLTL